MRARGAGRRSPSGFRPSRTLGAAVLIGGVAVAALAGASSDALADVLFVSDLSAVETYATASAGGSAYGAGDAGDGVVWSYTFTHAQAFSLSAGPSGSASAGFDTAVADFVGSSRSVTSERSAPVTTTGTEVTTRRDGDATVTTTTTATTTTTTTTMTEIAAFEVLASDRLKLPSSTIAVRQSMVGDDRLRRVFERLFRRLGRYSNHINADNQNYHDHRYESHGNIAGGHEDDQLENLDHEGRHRPDDSNDDCRAAVRSKQYTGRVRLCGSDRGQLFGLYVRCRWRSQPNGYSSVH